MLETLALSAFTGAESAEAHPLSLTWGQLVEALGKFDVRAEKNGAAWAPVSFSPPRRKLDNVKLVSALVYDLDNGAPPPLKCRHAAHTTHSGGWRLVLALSRPVNIAEFNTLWPLTLEELRLDADPACKDAAHLFYLPSHSPDCDFQPSAYSVEGPVIDVDACIGASEAPPPVLENSAEKIPAYSPPPAADLEHYRASADRLTDANKRKLLKALLNFELVPEARTAPGRDVTLHLAFNLLASIGDRPPDEAIALALLEPLLQRMDVMPEGIDYWREKAIYSFRRGLEHRLKRDESDARIAERIESLTARSSVPEEREWRERLLLRVNRDGDAIGVENKGYNVALLLENDIAFKGHIRFNVLSKSIEVRGGPLKGCNLQTLDVALSNYLARSDYRLDLSRHECAAQLLHVALSHPYDPVREYLEKLEWDGVPRIATALEKYAGAEGNLPYLRGVSQRFFVSAVARIMEPGCKVDTMLILQGEQGVGKTRFVEILATPWVATLKLDVGNKDSVLVATGSWLVELSELVSMRRSDSESLKAFLSTQVDMMRLPYGRSVEALPRRSVFVGTTNDVAPLNDPTGNRRFWPVCVTKLDSAALTRDRDQLWAEAVQAYRAGEKWYFTSQEESDLLDEERAAFEAEDLLANHILEWYLRKPYPRPVALTTLEIAKGCMSTMPDDLDNKLTRKIGAAMRALGWYRARLNREGRPYGYKIPHEIRTAELVKEETK